MKQMKPGRSRLATFIGTLLLSCGCSAEDPLESMQDIAFCGTALDAAQVQLGGFLKAYPDPTSIARSYDKGEAKMVAVKDWTSGFVAGSFWYMYEYSRE